MTNELNAKRDKLMDLWRSVIPQFCPSEFQFNLWLQIHAFDTDLITWGIKELACKYHRRGQMNDEHMVKFVSSVINRKKRENSERDGARFSSAPGLSSRRTDYVEDTRGGYFAE